MKGELMNKDQALLELGQEKGWFTSKTALDEKEAHDFLTFMALVAPSIRSDFLEAMPNLDPETLVSEFTAFLEYCTPSRYDTRFMPKYYRMDGATEDLLFDSEELREGMVVLIEDSSYRSDIRDEMSGSNLELALKVNRWGKISKLRRTDSMVQFIAEYEDGTKAKRAYPFDVGWYVKKDISRSEEVTQSDDTRISELMNGDDVHGDEKYKEVVRLLTDLVVKHKRETRHGACAKADELVRYAARVVADMI